MPRRAAIRAAVAITRLAILRTHLHAEAARARCNALISASVRPSVKRAGGAVLLAGPRADVARGRRLTEKRRRVFRAAVPATRLRRDHRAVSTWCAPHLFVVIRAAVAMTAIWRDAHAVAARDRSPQYHRARCWRRRCQRGRDGFDEDRRWRRRHGVEPEPLTRMHERDAAERGVLEHHVRGERARRGVDDAAAIGRTLRGGVHGSAHTINSARSNGEEKPCASISREGVKPSLGRQLRREAGPAVPIVTSAAPPASIVSPRSVSAVTGPLVCILTTPRASWNLRL